MCVWILKKKTRPKRRIHKSSIRWGQRNHRHKSCDRILFSGNFPSKKKIAKTLCNDKRLDIDCLPGNSFGQTLYLADLLHWRLEGRFQPIMTLLKNSLFIHHPSLSVVSPSIVLQAYIENFIWYGRDAKCHIAYHQFDANTHHEKREREKKTLYGALLRISTQKNIMGHGVTHHDAIKQEIMTQWNGRTESGHCTEMLRNDRLICPWSSMMMTMMILLG